MDRIERREFVRKHRTCIFGYNRQNDGPAMTVVYYVPDGDDVLIRVIDLMAEKDVTSAKLPEIEQMAREENRVVIRIRPYATFATPPRHVYKAEDIDTLTHFTSNSQ